MKFEKDQLGPYQERYLEQWKRYLESNTIELKESFTEIISLVKENQPNPIKKVFQSFIKEDKSNIRKVEFWHQAWELDFTVQFLDADEDVLVNPFSKKYLFQKYEDFEETVDNNFLYPKDCDVYLESARAAIADRMKFNLFFCWFTKTWIACGGHQLNILTTTEENSVRRIFNLNLINWFDDIEYLYPTKSLTVKFPVKRDLTDFEIESRVNMDSLSRFKTRWRYLEKEDDFVEYGIYNFIVYKREGNKNKPNKFSFKEIGKERKIMSQEIDILLSKGYFEIQRPDNFPKLFPNLVEWNAPSYRPNKLVKAEEFLTLESNIGFKLPESYKWFLTRMNHQDHLSGMTQFRYDFEDWRTITSLIKVDEFIDQLISLHKDQDINRSLFPFVHCGEQAYLLMEHHSENIYYLAQNEPPVKLFDTFQEFLGNTTTITDYFCPRKVHIEKENLTLLKDWFDKGWEMDDLKMNPKNSIMQISNSEEVNELLLKNGADPNLLWVSGSQVSRKFLDLLIQYGYDFKLKLEQDKSLGKALKKRKEFDDLWDNLK